MRKDHWTYLGAIGKVAKSSRGSESQLGEEPSTGAVARSLSSILDLHSYSVLKLDELLDYDFGHAGTFVLVLYKQSASTTSS
jgi:hypothetical protein